MADGLGTASSVLKGAGGIASMIPGYGTMIGAGLSTVGGILDMVDAQKQKEEAQKIQQKAEQVKKQPLEKEYLAALRAKKMMALSGLPQYEQAKENLDLDAANALKSIEESSPYGGSVVSAINAVLNKGSQQKRAIDVEQAKAKLGLKKDVIDTLWGVGGQQRELTKEQRSRQEALYSQAQDLMAAATANKQIGREKAIGAGIQGIGGLAKILGNMNMSKYGTVGQTQLPQTESMVSPSTLNLSLATSAMGNIPLSAQEVTSMRNKLVSDGTVADEEAANDYLKKLGFNF